MTGSMAKSGEEGKAWAFPELRRVRLSHGELAYREAGSGEPIVFLHGMNGDSRSWIRQFERLAGGFRIVSWDAPGFGGSDPCPGSAEAFVKAGFEFLAAIGAGRVTLVGHSMGGVVAARMAAASTAAGDGAVRRLVLSCTHWGHCQEPGAPLQDRYTKRIEEMSAIPRERYGRIRALAMVPPGSSEEVLSLLAMISSEARPEGLESAGRMVQESDNRPIYGSIEMPVLVVYAEKDRVAKPDTSQRLLSMLPRASSFMVKGAGHAPYAEDHESYNRAILDFVRG